MVKPLQSAVRSVVLAPVTAATTARTAAIDTSGADYAIIEIVAGAEANTNSTNVVLNLRESDTNSATTFATFDANFSTVLDNTAGAVAVFNVDLKGRKKFLQVVVTPDTTTNGAVITSCVSALVMDKQGANSANANCVVVG
jgi:hypothetical protein